MNSTFCDKKLSSLLNVEIGKSGPFYFVSIQCQVDVVGPTANSKSLLQICIIKLNLHAPCNYEVRQVK